MNYPVQPKPTAGIRFTTDTKSNKQTNKPENGYSGFDFLFSRQHSQYLESYIYFVVFFKIYFLFIYLF